VEEKSHVTFCEARQPSQGHEVRGPSKTGTQHLVC
jgi:hypothetical protein